MADEFMKFRVAKDPVEQDKYYALKALPNGKEYFFQITHKNVSYWYMYLYYIILYDENGNKLVPESIQRVNANSATFRVGDVDGELYSPIPDNGVAYGLDKLLTQNTSGYWLNANANIAMATEMSGFYIRFSKPMTISKFEFKQYYNNSYPQYGFYDINLYCDNVLWGIFKSGNKIVQDISCDLKKPANGFSLVKNSNKFNPNYIPKGSKLTIRPLMIGSSYNGCVYLRNLHFFDSDYNKIPITEITAVDQKKATFKLGDATCTMTCELDPYSTAATYSVKNIVEPITTATVGNWFLAKNVAGFLRTPKADIVLQFDKEISFAGLRMCLGSTSGGTLPDTNPPTYYMSDFSLLIDDVEIYRKPNSNTELLVDVNFKKPSDGVKRASLKRINTPQTI